MLPADAHLWAGWSARADVGRPQAGLLGDFSCQSAALWAKLREGRVKMACPSKWGRGDALSSLAPAQEYRSRGCRRARTLFWRSQWLPSWQLAPRKKKPLFMWMSRFRLSLPTPASTSNRNGRAHSNRMPPAPPESAHFGVMAPLGAMTRGSVRRKDQSRIRDKVVKVARLGYVFRDILSPSRRIVSISQSRRLSPFHLLLWWRRARQSLHPSCQSQYMTSTVASSPIAALRPSRSAPTTPSVCRSVTRNALPERCQIPMPFHRPPCRSALRLTKAAIRREHSDRTRSPDPQDVQSRRPACFGLRGLSPNEARG